MRTGVVWLVCMLLLGAGVSDAQAQAEKVPAQPGVWQTDWSAFVKEYGNLANADNVPALKQFVGKDVVWKAKVKKVYPPAKGKATGGVTLEMAPPLLLGPLTIDSLYIEPSPDDWQVWARIAVGQEVVFKTHLTGLRGDAASSPISFFRLKDGTVEAQLFTKGGTLVNALK